MDLTFDLEGIVQYRLIRPTRPIAIFLLIREIDRKLAQAVRLADDEALLQQDAQLKEEIDALSHKREDAISIAAISAISRMDQEIANAKSKRSAIAEVLDNFKKRNEAAFAERAAMRRQKNLHEARLFNNSWIFNPVDDPIEAAEIKTDRALLDFLFLDKEYEGGASHLRPLREPKVLEALEMFKNAVCAEVEVKKQRAA